MDATAKRVYRQTSAEQRALERKQRLLDAALQLFSSTGYAHSTIEALCSEAKVTTRHFYQAFSSREALLLCLYEQLIQDLQTALLVAVTVPDLSVSQKIERLVYALVEHYLQDRRRAQVGVLEVVGASPAVEQRRREVIQGIAQLIQAFMNQLADDDRIPRHDYRLIALAIVGGINEIMADWLTNPVLSLDQLAQEMIFAMHTFMNGAQPLITAKN